MIPHFEILHVTPPQVALDQEGCHACREQTGQADPEDQQDRCHQATGGGLGGRIEAAEQQEPDVPERISPGREVRIGASLDQVDRRAANKPGQEDPRDDPADLVAVPGRQRREENLTPGPRLPGAKDDPAPAHRIWSWLSKLGRDVPNNPGSRSKHHYTAAGLAGA